MNKTIVALAALSVAATATPAVANPLEASKSTTIEVSVDQSGRPIVAGLKLQSHDDREQLASTTGPVVKNGVCGYHCRKAPGEAQA